MSEAVLQENDALLGDYHVRQLITQLRAMDSYGTYDTWSDCKVLDPLILTRERRRDIPVVGDPDEVVISRVKAYYNAIACSVEKECGLMTMPVVNLSHEGFGRALVIVGKLVVLDKTLRDVHRFGFSSLEKLKTEMETLTGKAIEMVGRFPEAARL